VNLEILGNPKIKGNTIQQDKAIVLKEKLLKSKNPEKYLKQSVELILKCWKYGFSEKVFNITINNGVNKKGKVI